MEEFQLKTLTRRAKVYFDNSPPTERHPAFRHAFTQVPGRQFTNGYGVPARLFVVNRPPSHNRYYATLVLQDVTTRVRGHDSSDEGVQYLRGDAEEIQTAVSLVLQQFRDIQYCDGCHCLIKDQENCCLDCELLSAVGRKDQVCAICQEGTDLYATLPCDHHYHVQCLAGLKSRSCDECEEGHMLKCPQCRREFSLPLGSEE